MTVTQTTNSATYNWQSFNIGKVEAVHFQQPNVSSVALNYVLGNTNSIIDGSLTSNGQLFLSNPNGIIFGASAQVNAAGLTLQAGAGQISNAGSITVNGGALKATAGLINNTGLIQANSAVKVGGKIVLTAGTMISNTGKLDASGISGGSIALDAGTSVLQQGTMISNGRAGAGGVIDVVSQYRIIQNSSSLTSAVGTLTGGSISYRTNIAKLDGGLMLSGKIDAHGNGNGGSLVLTGPNVELIATRLDASGGLNGGTINIGGGFQGKNPAIANAQKVDVNASTRINAGGALGDGGNVVLWSDKQTTFSGNIVATGGKMASRGGQVEVSGKSLGFNGKVSTVTANGRKGTLLLDPVDLIIQGTSGPKPRLSMSKTGDVVELSNGNLVVWDPNDATAVRGAGTVWLFDGSTGALISTLTGTVWLDYLGENGITPLSNGNFVVNSPSWRNGNLQAAGAVTWVNGVSGLSGMVSSSNSLVGTAQGDRIGLGGVVELSNGNYLVNSYEWSNAAGAVTWVDGSNGLTGAVSVANSLVGGRAGDRVGWSGIAQLLSGNYVVKSPDWGGTRGAATWGDATTGVTGVVSSANSLVGSAAGDLVGGHAIVGLEDVLEVGNDHYLIISPFWGNNRGAVTWGNSLTGVSGVISSANSLVGSTSGAWGVGDSVGSRGITLLSNDGNYIVNSPWWNGGRGAVTWGNGMTGTSGVVSSANSLVGSAAGDLVGSGGNLVLNNGNYVVASPGWNTGRGAVTWGSGATGVSGILSSSNSLVGSTPGDYIGFSGPVGYPNRAFIRITALTNGNYVVASSFWNGGLGAVTWGNGTAGTTGVVSAQNSLVGTVSTDHVGSGNVTPLANGNYVVASPAWSLTAGAVTWGDGTTGVAGEVSALNSLTGAAAGDAIGVVLGLSNGNYVVSSSEWGSAGIYGAGLGAVTWGDGQSGTTGVVSAANSLVGTAAGDSLGRRVRQVGAGNYLVISDTWNGGAGAVTWADGSTGLVGAISATNSLVGSSPTDNIGAVFVPFTMTTTGVTVLKNGNYVVNSPRWNAERGAVTWGDGNAGVTGVVSAANSLVGSVSGDQIGRTGVRELQSGDYLVMSSTWNDWRGAATLGSGSAGVTGVVSAANSLVGEIGGGFFVGDMVGYNGVKELPNGNLLVGSRQGWAWSVESPMSLTGALSTHNPEHGAIIALSGNRFALATSGLTPSLSIFDGSFNVVTPLGTLPTNTISYGSVLAPTETIDPAAITAITNNGTAVTLQASNDIRVNSPIITTPGLGVLKGGDLTLSAGRSLLINADINTAGGSLTLIANDLVANGVVAHDRASGVAVVQQGFGTINTGSGLLSIDLRNGGTGGSVTLGNITTAGMTVNSSTGSIDQLAGTAIVVNGASSFVASDGQAVPNKYAITLDGTANDFVGRVSTYGKAITLVDGAGGLVLGNTTASGALSVTSSGGAISQAALTSITAGSTSSFTAIKGGATIYASSPDRPPYAIGLYRPTNDFVGSVATYGAAVTLVDGAGGLVLGNTTASGALKVISRGGHIRQAASTSITAVSASSFTASNGLPVPSKYNIVLNSSSNYFVGAVSTNGAAITLSSSWGLTLGNTSASGPLNAVSRSGLIRQAAATRISAGSVSSFIANYPIKYPITLGNAGNNFVGAVATNGGAVTLVDSVGGLILGNTTAQDALRVISKGGPISQRAATRIVANITSTITASNLLPVPAKYAIRLNSAANNFVGKVSATGSAITLRDVNAMDVALNSTGGSVLIAGGTLSIAGKVGTALRISSKGAVKKTTPATALTVKGMPTNPANPSVNVNGVAGALIL